MSFVRLEATGAPFLESGRKDVTVACLFQFEDFQCGGFLTLPDSPNAFRIDDLFQPCPRSASLAYL